MIDNKLISSKDLLSFFREAGKRRAISTQKSSNKAIGVLEAFIKKKECEEIEFTDSFLSEWLLYMYLRGLTVKTSIHYFDLISSLYKAGVNENIFPYSTAFKSVRERISASDRRQWEEAVTEEEFKRMVNLTQTSFHQKGTMGVASDLVLFSLLNACRSLKEIAALKNSDVEELDEESVAVVDRQSSSRRRYIFALRQSEFTPLQLTKYIHELVFSLFRMKNISMKGTVEETISAYWAYAALRCGFSGEEVVSCLGCASNSIPFLSLFGPIEISPDRYKEISQTVGSVFVVNPLKWFAMRLRPGVKFDELNTRFSQLKDEMSIPEIFYPRNEIVKRVGKKLKYESKPVISDIVFFRTRITEILPLFFLIGDLAWCYTTGGRGSRTYASISDESFKTFQQAIGQFTPDFEVAPVGELPMREGDRIVIVGGMMPGQVAEVAKIETDSCDNIIYRVKFGTENGFKWDFGVDARITKEKKA